jgi:hypothetical protein
MDLGMALEKEGLILIILQCSRVLDLGVLKKRFFRFSWRLGVLALNRGLRINALPRPAGPFKREVAPVPKGGDPRVPEFFREPFRTHEGEKELPVLAEG